MSTVRLAHDGAIAHVILDRPAQLNAINPELLRDLDAVCDVVEADPAVRAVMLTGAGRAFCAGADLRVVEELAPDPEKWAAFMDLWHRVFDRIERLPPPVIAGVHGLALAGGLELVMVCDLVVCDEAARFGDQHDPVPGPVPGLDGPRPGHAGRLVHRRRRRDRREARG